MAKGKRDRKSLLMGRVHLLKGATELRITQNDGCRALKHDEDHHL